MYLIAGLITFFKHVLHRAHLFQCRYPSNAFSISLASIEPLLDLTKHHSIIQQIARESFIDAPRDLLNIPESEKQVLLKKYALEDQYRANTLKQKPFIKSGHAPIWRSAIVIAIGVSAALAVGFLYGAFGGAHTDYLISLLCATILGATIALSSRAVRLTDFRVKLYAGLLAGFLAVGYGHDIGYYLTFKDGVYYWLKHEAPSSYAAMRELPKEAAVQEYMARVLGLPPPHVFFSSMRVRAKEGTEASQ